MTCALVAGTAATAAVAAPPPGPTTAQVRTTKPAVGVPGESAAARDARMAWWRAARFGLFVHWGVYAVPAQGEWYMTNAKVPIPTYEAFAARFDPVKFDADRIAATAEAAGQKYLVITAKHHDGFCMFRTATTRYNVVDATPWHTDPLALLAPACRRHNVKFCCYYSIMDWHSPDQQAKDPSATRPTYNPTHFQSPEHKAAYVAYMKAQLKELIEQYHPAVLWFDGEWASGWTAADGVDLVAYLYGLDPALILNDRTKGGGDYGTPEQKVPAGGNGKDWETCMTIGQTWGYAAADRQYKPADVLIRNLCDIASKGGNYLLNVGPTPLGTIPQPEVDSLRGIGDWLTVNGDAIYGTTAGPFAAGQLPWGRATRKGNTLYLIVFDWPKDGKLVVPLATSVTRAYCLADKGGALTAASTPTGVTIRVPAVAPDETASVVVLECAVPPVATTQATNGR